MSINHNILKNRPVMRISFLKVRIHHLRTRWTRGCVWHKMYFLLVHPSMFIRRKRELERGNKTVSVWWRTKRYSLRKFIYYGQQIKRDLQRILISGCRCNERLKSNSDGLKRLEYTEVEGPQLVLFFVYYEGIKRDLNRKHITVSVWWKTKSDTPYTFLFIMNR